MDGCTRAEVGMVESIYEQTTAIVVVGEGASEKCEDNIGGQRAEPAAVHSSTGPHQQEYGDEECHEETPLCRRPESGGE